MAATHVSIVNVMTFISRAPRHDGVNDGSDMHDLLLATVALKTAEAEPVAERQRRLEATATIDCATIGDKPNCPILDVNVAEPVSPPAEGPETGQHMHLP